MAVSVELTRSDATKRVLDSGRTRLGGKTAEQTITACSPSPPSRRAVHPVDKGSYALAEAPTAPAGEGRAEEP